MAADMLDGRRLELESLNGAVVRLGRELGVATPLNFAVYAALKPYVNGAPASA
jgi:2-dehydropantoate 2-reductase